MAQPLDLSSRSNLIRTEQQHRKQARSSGIKAGVAGLTGIASGIIACKTDINLLVTFATATTAAVSACYSLKHAYRGYEHHTNAVHASNPNCLFEPD